MGPLDRAPETPELVFGCSVSKLQRKALLRLDGARAGGEQSADSDKSSWNRGGEWGARETGVAQSLEKGRIVAGADGGFSKERVRSATCGHRAGIAAG